ncbi:hypothetical protein BLNAU_14982 [Blattamonas nauphoetae]|uniref:G-protein coupled receptors family 1 profile domain-containing protein n=1 Tax=Blattamonas nauphoetae TaxID=2049346 RepID=A0ABQ9XF80_9EUKA|nr:hypothetical protein BLNAU_14982 [Blattamonas nauphoetae]
MESQTLPVQKELLESCPMVYGPGGWPVIVMTSINFLIGLFVFNEMISSMQKCRWRKSPSRHIFILCLSVVQILNLINSLVPIPWDYTSALVLCDQIPRYLFYVSWEFISMWLGSAIIGPGRTKKCVHRFRHIVYALVLILTFFNKHQSDSLRYVTVASNSLMYITVCASLSIDMVRLWRILCNNMLLPTYRSRIKLLTLLVATVFVVYVTRFFWAIFKATGINIIQNAFDTARNQCRDDDVTNRKQCMSYYGFSSIILFIFEDVPTIFLLVTFTIIKLHVSSSRKNRKKISERYAINDQLAARYFYSSSGDSPQVGTQIRHHRSRNSNRHHSSIHDDRSSQHSVDTYHV